MEQSGSFPTSLAIIAGAAILGGMIIGGLVTLAVLLMSAL